MYIVFIHLYVTGIYYFIRLRIKTWQRSAIIITNKRIIEMTVNQRKGRIPVAFNGFRAVVRYILYIHIAHYNKCINFV